MRRILLLLSLLCALVFCSSASYGQSEGANSYQKWVTEDVAYIITPQEQSAFSKLKTNDEREEFIEAFWRRRDPNPATEENEYREEYYERIAYANENFTFAGLAGWRTDRGRTYILYGAPDEKQKTATGEIWKYSHSPALGGASREFEFTDASGTGDLRLKAKP